MAENSKVLSEYSINKKKYLQLFHALCQNSKEKRKSVLPNFDESLISKKINQLEQRTSNNINESDWISKKIHEKTSIAHSKKKVVIVRDKTHVSKLDSKQHKKAINELKAHIHEAKKHYLSLKQKGVSKEHLENFKKRIDDLEKKLE